jgi:glycosyltransferase involved in cell wall biosynthesis
MSAEETQTRVSIGILAWNEEQGITHTIESLFEQSLFKPNGLSRYTVEVVCIPNGCIDNTATVAESAFQEQLRKAESSQVSCQVCEVKTPGKSNAWNQYVHHHANQDADFVFLMDADIWFDNPHTLENMVVTLEQNPLAQAASDQPIKHLHKNASNSFFDRMSLMASQEKKTQVAQICGQLYCVRGPVIRDIWMPTGLTVEDGFIKAMLVTDCFRQEEDLSRIVLAPDASHIFDAYTSFGDFFAHEKMLWISITIDNILKEYLRNHAGQEGAGAFIKSNTESDPDWYTNLLKDYFGRGWWVMPSPFKTHRFKGMGSRGLPYILKYFPVRLLRLLIDIVVIFYANWTIKRSNSVYFWDKTRES